MSLFLKVFFLEYFENNMNLYFYLDILSPESLIFGAYLNIAICMWNL